MTTNGLSSELELAERRLTESMRLAWGSAKKSRGRNTYATNLAADILSRSRITPFRHILTLLGDSCERGAPKEVLLAVADQLRHEVERMYGTEEVGDFDHEHLGETQAQTEADVAEALLRIEKSHTAYQRLVLAYRKHCVKAERQLKAAAQMVGAL